MWLPLLQSPATHGPKGIKKYEEPHYSKKSWTTSREIPGINFNTIQKHSKPTQLSSLTLKKSPMHLSSPLFTLGQKEQEKFNVKHQNLEARNSIHEKLDDSIGESINDKKKHPIYKKYTSLKPLLLSSSFLEKYSWESSPYKTFVKSHVSSASKDSSLADANTASSYHSTKTGSKHSPGLISPPSFSFEKKETRSSYFDAKLPSYPQEHSNKQSSKGANPILAPLTPSRKDNKSAEKFKHTARVYKQTQLEPKEQDKAVSSNLTHIPAKVNSSTFSWPGSFDLPMSASNLLRNFQLLPMEEREVLSYRQIWYYSQGEAVKEDEKNDCKLDLPMRFSRGHHVRYRYELQSPLGEGAFGCVYSAYDWELKTPVALKFIKQAEQNHSQYLLEIEILNKLRKDLPEDKDHILQLLNHFVFRGYYIIVNELLGPNLYSLLKSRKFVGCPTLAIKRFSSQLCPVMGEIHNQGIIHCDLKPENIVMYFGNKHSLKGEGNEEMRKKEKSSKEKQQVLYKIIDFGTSTYKNQIYYTYIQSRFYRAPEIVLQIKYNEKIDVWSFGCVLVELYTGSPLFSAKNEKQLLEKIVSVIGPPSWDLLRRSKKFHKIVKVKELLWCPFVEALEECPSTQDFFNAEGDWLVDRIPKEIYALKPPQFTKEEIRKNLHDIMRCRDTFFPDFVARCISWDPYERASFDQLRLHPFLQNVDL